MPLAEPVKIVIDSVHMERALINLINNAIDASDGGQTVLISSVAERNYVVIRISDKGGGIDRETIENIYNPFFSTKSSGTGLGMAIAKKIIEEHQGSISVQSTPGSGTEVLIELPYRGMEKR